MSPPSGEHWTSMVCMAELQGKKPLLSKQNIAAVYGSLKTTWISQKVIRTMFCEWMRPKSNFLAWMRSVLFGDEQTLHSSKNLILSVKQGGGSIMVWAALLPLNQDSLQSLKYWAVPAHSIGKCQGINMWTEAQQKVDHAVRQQRQTHKSLYQRMVRAEER